MNSIQNHLHGYYFLLLVKVVVGEIVWNVVLSEKRFTRLFLL